MSVTICRDFEQRSVAWYEARCGMVTASTIGQLVSMTSPGPSAYPCQSCGAEPGESCVSLRNGEPIKTPHAERSVIASQMSATAKPVLAVADTDTARGVLDSLAAERITGLAEETPTTGDMWRGVIAEPFARAAYAEWRGVDVEEVGLIVRELAGGMRIGYSPDGLVSTDGQIEIKAPRAKGHIGTVISGEVPARHMAQLQTGLFASGRAWVDYVSFSGGLHLWAKRVEPDPEWQSVILAALAWAEVGIADRIANYQAATTGLPLTEPLPTYDDITI